MRVEGVGDSARQVVVTRRRAHPGHIEVGASGVATQLAQQSLDASFGFVHLAAPGLVGQLADNLLILGRLQLRRQRCREGAAIAK
jgi:hypothetical protein